MPYLPFRRWMRVGHSNDLGNICTTKAHPYLILLQIIVWVRVIFTHYNEKEMFFNPHTPRGVSENSSIFHCFVSHSNHHTPYEVCPLFNTFSFIPILTLFVECVYISKAGNFVFSAIQILTLLAKCVSYASLVLAISLDFKPSHPAWSVSDAPVFRMTQKNSNPHTPRRVCHPMGCTHIGCQLFISSHSARSVSLDVIVRALTAWFKSSHSARSVSGESYGLRWIGTFKSSHSARNVSPCESRSVLPSLFKSSHSVRSVSRIKTINVDGGVIQILTLCTECVKSPFQHNQRARYSNPHTPHGVCLRLPNLSRQQVSFKSSHSARSVSGKY